jgi:hypothetical protein
MRCKPKPKQQVKKDFEKLTRKVGQRKVSRNHTAENSLRSRRVVMPTQKIETNHQLAEYLVGLRHYNEKKRLDAVNGMIRLGPDCVSEEKLGEVIISLGYCLCDIDTAVRNKCSNYLFDILSGLDDSILRPFYPKVFIQLQAALSNVRTEVRSDAVSFLHRIESFPVFDSIEILQLIKSLIEVNSALLSNQTYRVKAGKNGQSSDIRTTVFSCIVGLLESLLEKQKEVDDGYINPSDWTISHLLERAFNSSISIGQDMKKLLVSLEKQGEEVFHAKIEGLANDTGLLIRNLPEAFQPVSKHPPKKKPSSSSSAFSKLSQLLRDDSD